ncbi:hypothetical protein PINS_up005150 [Pythium insidiosum]|nr:hypothetical protein PINS_up005150 [Pythium insidiosum]
MAMESAASASASASASAPRFVLAVARVHRWARGCEPSSTSAYGSSSTASTQRDALEFFCGDEDVSVTRDDALLVARMVVSALSAASSLQPRQRRTSAVGTTSQETTNGVDASGKVVQEPKEEEIDEEEEEEEEELFNRAIDALVFREPSAPATTGSSSLQTLATPSTRDRWERCVRERSPRDGQFVHLPCHHALHNTMRAIAVPDPRFRRTFFVQQEVRVLVLFSDAPFYSFLKERLEDLAFEWFAAVDDAHSMGDSTPTTGANQLPMTLLERLYQLLTHGVRFDELPYREVYSGLPVVPLIKQLGNDILAVLRVLLLEGRVVCFSSRPDYAAASSLALLSLLPGTLVAEASSKTFRTIDAAIYRLRRLGLPLDLLRDDACFVYQPCFTSDQETELYAKPGFLAATSDPMLLKRPGAKLDLVLDLDQEQIITYPTPKTELAFAYGSASSAFADSLAERLGRNLKPTSDVPGVAVKTDTPPSRRRRMRESLRRSLFRGRPGPSCESPAHASEQSEGDLDETDWVLEQFRKYMEHFIEDGVRKGVLADSSSIDCGEPEDGQEGTKRSLEPSLRSRFEELAVPILFGDPATAFNAEYGRAWVQAWQQTENYSRWRVRHREAMRSRRLSLSTSFWKASPGTTTPQDGHATYRYPNGDEFDGEFRRGKRHGHGIYVEFLSKTQYDGQWLDDKRHGHGVLSAPSLGYIYDGEWVDDVRCGQGHSTLKNVENYTGEWQNNQFHGVGVYSNAAGDVYDGEWRCGLRDGAGKLTTAARSPAATKDDKIYTKAKDTESSSSSPALVVVQYVGEWRRDMFHGVGTADYEDGAQYSGAFQDGKFHGHGVLVFANGDRYEGQWWKGFRHGEGAFFSAASGITMEGTWRKNAAVDSFLPENDDASPDPQFKITTAATWFITYPNGDKYSGQCRRGRPWGEGVCKYANGSSYSGRWVDGLREGQGVCVSADGSILEGEWHNSAFVRPRRSPSRFVDVPLVGTVPTDAAQAKSASSARARGHSSASTSDTPPAEGTHVFVYRNGDRYEGSFVQHRRHGVGVLTEHATGNVYEGEWHEDERHGRGVLTSGLGDFIYDGEWRNDARCGQGHCVIRGCETYSGEWLANQFHGMGTYVDAEGNVYEGEFAVGKKHGVGKETTASTQAQYSGEWRDGHRHGIGVAAFVDGATYSGSWRLDLPDGEGTHMSPNGERFVGQWRRGLRDGAGVVFTPSTGVTKEGVWRADVPLDGEWTISFADGSKFTGQCINGRPHGHGVCKYATGELYDGAWVDGKRHGHGAGFFANGESFVGEWENNHVALHGKGQLTLADGTVHVYAN